MSREKPGFRDTLALLNELFPDRVALNKAEVARAMGCDRSTVTRRGIRFNEATGRVTKADLARQICI